MKYNNIKSICLSIINLEIEMQEENLKILYSKRKLLSNGIEKKERESEHENDIEIPISIPDKIPLEELKNRDVNTSICHCKRCGQDIKLNPESHLRTYPKDPDDFNDEYSREEQADDWYYFFCGNCGDDRQLDEDEYNEIEDYLDRD